ncbi:DUF2442 domain-containing protein [Candidatus Saccharibacteria bacterium]|nr:DUF2442 domain-containing protein [Candidatus Saccharibacteria bacterium]
MYNLNDKVEIKSSFGERSPVWVVTDVVANDDYTLTVTFITGEKKQYDFKPLLKYKIFEPLKNIGFFKTAHVSYSTVVWNDKIDIAPESLYADGILVQNN